MKAKSMVTRFVASVIGKAAFVAAASCATSALAAVNNLESYHFRHDFSTGARVFIGGANCPADFISDISADSVAVAGPNGPGSAMHIGQDSGPLNINGVQVNSNDSSSTKTTDLVLNTNAWTLVMSFRPGNIEKGMLFSIGRLNGGGSSGRIAITVCSSSDPTKLYLQEFYRGSSGSVPEKGNSVELTGLGNMTNGFHTLVMVYSPSDKTVTPYVDGTKKTVLTLSSKTTTSRAVGNYFQYGSFPSITGNVSGFSRSYTNTDVAFYDLRFYLGAFSDADATAYAALYPADRMGSPFRPSAYVEASATNTAGNATVGSYVDTGYLAKGATTRFMADYQFLDLRGQQRIFGARGDFVQGLYIRGSNPTGNLAWNFMGKDSWVNMSKGAVEFRQIATFDRVGKTIAVTNYADRAQFYYNASHAELTKATSDATSTTYLFSENDSGAKNYGKARIYSFEADESGTLVHFFAPATNAVGEAGFKDIITGDFKGDGNKENNPERTLRFYDGVGCASDYKYEDSTLYAKLYASVGDSSQGTVSVASGAAAASAEGWVPRGGTLALSAVPASESYEFDSWTGDTWAIADGYSVSNASIEVSTPYAVQLRATFKPAVNALLTIASDGASAVNWSAADWRDIDDSSVSISAPVDKEVTVVVHKSVTLTLDVDVSLSKFVVQADANCVVTFASSGSSTFCANEVVVSNGVFKLGTDGVLGATPLVTVKDGATFDFNGKVVGDGEAEPGNVVTEFHIAGAGAGDWPWVLTSSADMANNKNVGMLYLDANATVGGAKEMWMGVRDGAGWDSNNKNLNLNGFTLTKTGAGTLQVRRPYSGNEGTIDVQSGSVRVSGWSKATAEYGQCCVSNIALVVREGAAAENGGYGSLVYPVYFKTIDWLGGSLTTSSKNAFGVYEALSGHGTTAKLTMADGAAATLDGNLSVTTTLTADGALSLARKTGVETNVTVFVSGTFASVTGNTITVGQGVILDLGTSRPAATLAVDAAGALALRLTANDEAPVLNVSTNPANLVVYKPDGVTDITSSCTIEYDAEAGTIAITPPVPVWTNTDGTGSFENVANWDSGEVPADGSSICVSNATDVTIAVSSAHAYEYVSVKGGATLSFTGNGLLTANTMAFSDGTELKTGGVVVPAAFNGTGDLVVESGNGAEYSVTGASALTGKLTIKATASFTNTLSAAVNVTNMTVDADANVVVTLVKGSGGSFYANEVVVAGGVLQQGSASVLGTTPKLTVLDGGTFDINKLKIENATKSYIAGAGAGNWPWAICSRAGSMVDGNYLANITLNADATIGGPGQLKIGVSDSAGNEILLNGHKLTLSGYWATFRNLNTTAGTLELASGYTITLNKWHNLNSNSGTYSGTTLIVRNGANVVNQTDRTIKAKNIQLDGGSITAKDTQTFSPISVLSGHGTIARLAIPTGAVYRPDGADYLNVTSSLSGTLKVDISDPTVAGKLDPSLAGKMKIPLLKVPTALKATADGAFDLTVLPPGWELKSKEINGNVEYWIKSSGLSIILR